MKAGDLLKIKKGTIVRSLALQDNIKFEKDIIVEITNTILGDNTFFFGKIKILLFEHMVPGLVDKAHGELGPLDYRETIPYKLPEMKEYKCVVCDKVIEKLYPDSKNLNEKPWEGMWNYGIVDRIAANFGSDRDGDIFIIGICDNCITDKKLEKAGNYLGL